MSTSQKHDIIYAYVHRNGSLAVKAIDFLTVPV